MSFDGIRKKRRLTEYPLRVCYSMHHCCLCPQAITLGQYYYDGGYSRRAHLKCADANAPSKERHG